MKKFLTVLLALTLVIGSLVVLNACGGGADTTALESTTPETTEAPAAPTAPEGYTMYDNGDIAFAYPSAFTVTDGSTVILTGTNGNNITVVYEAKNDVYATMDVAGFNEQFVPAFEAMGLTVSNPSVTQTKNDTGLAITKISYTASVSGTSMKQTLYVSTVGSRTYTVTVTEVVSDAAFVNNVFDTLHEVK